MPLAGPQLGRLAAADRREDFDQLLLTWDDHIAACVWYARRRGGVLLVAPPEVVSAVEREAARGSGFGGLLGPSVGCTVAVVDSESGAEDEVAVTLVDFKSDVRTQLARCPAEGPADEDIVFVTEQGGELC